MRLAAAALVTVVAAAAPAAAQQHDQHAAGGAAVPAMCVLGGGMEHGAQGGMQHGAQAAPGAQGGMAHMTLWSHEFMMYQHHAKDLELTADQASRIERIRSTAQGSCTHHAHMAMQSQAAAETEFARAAPDLAVFQAKLDEAAQHHTMAHVAVAKAALEAFALLTPAQRTKALAERAEHAAKAKGGAAGHTGH